MTEQDKNKLIEQMMHTISNLWYNADKQTRDKLRYNLEEIDIAYDKYLEPKPDTED